MEADASEVARQVQLVGFVVRSKSGHTLDLWVEPEYLIFLFPFSWGLRRAILVVCRTMSDTPIRI